MHKKGLLKKNAVPTIATPAETLTHTVSIPNHLNYFFFHINENVDYKLFKLLVKKKQIPYKSIEIKYIFLYRSFKLWGCNYRFEHLVKMLRRDKGIHSEGSS